LFPIIEFLIITPEPTTQFLPIFTLLSIMLLDPTIELLPTLTFLPTKTLLPNFTFLKLTFVGFLSDKSG